MRVMTSTRSSGAVAALPSLPFFSSWVTPVIDCVDRVVVPHESESVEQAYPDGSFDFAISEYGACSWADPYRWIPEAARLLRLSSSFPTRSFRSGEDCRHSNFNN